MTETRQSPPSILLAEDDADDRILIREAMEEGRLDSHLSTVTNGEELLEYLRHRGHQGRAPSRRLPSLILLDLNMPRKDGRTALREIRADRRLRHIPVVVLTTSNAEEDIRSAYDAGVNSFIIKPASFAQMVEILRVVSRYWFGIAQLPVGG